MPLVNLYLLVDIYGMDTPTYTGTAADILDAAENRMRSGGYDAVSFRDLATEVGIKSASVHYHFPQKADLGEAVVRRYTDRILAALAASDDPADSVTDRIARLCQVYRSAVLGDGMVCLCCVLGAETLDLPAPVADAVGDYFTRLLAWTETALGNRGDDAPGTDRPGPSAAQINASLQGAMILALATRQPALFEETADGIMAGIAP